MKIALLITCYNRPEYLRRTIASLERSDLSKVDVMVIDDASTDKETLFILENEVPKEWEILFASENGSIKKSLLTGFDHLFSEGFDIVINLDGDALVRNDFVSVLLSLHKRFPENLITGFNSDTLNADGSIRHHIIEQGEGFNVKKSVGGINMLVTKQTYTNYVRPALVHTLQHSGNWDNNACLRSPGVIVAQPSVIQHIGYESSMGHSGEGREKPDTASDFKSLHLPYVTLIGVDGFDADRLRIAAEKCTRDIEFGSVVMITNIPIKSKEEYSRFCIKELYKYVHTEHMLVFQHDGFVINADAWEDHFLQYDYIGAPWEWYRDGMQVGNGGFSLRSRKLMEMVANDPSIDDFHPEDDRICRHYGPYLHMNGIKFAPIEVARRFALEGYKHDRTYRGQFGVHGSHINYGAQRDRLLIVQPFGLGDIIFTQTLIRSMGYTDITWPVVDAYVDDCNRAYPDIKFIPISKSPVDLNDKRDMVRAGYRTLPIRFSDTIQSVPYNRVMAAKYDMFGAKWEFWRNKAMWNRDRKREQSLWDLLELEGKSYTVVNNRFGWQGDKQVFIPEIDGEAVQVRNIHGYSLFDWAMVFERAWQIHTVSTSILFILDLLETGPVHVYIRKPNESNHENYNYIFTDTKFIYTP